MIAFNANYLRFRSGGHFVYRSGTILAILVGSHLSNIPEKFELHLKLFLFLALAAILFIEAERI